MQSQQTKRWNDLARWILITLLFSLLLPAGYSLLSDRLDTEIPALFFAGWLLLPFIALIRLLAERARYYSQYLAGCAAVLGLSALTWTLPAALIRSGAFGLGSRIALTAELVIIALDAEGIRRNEILRKKALKEQDISWQDHPSFLENPPPVLAVVPAAVYLLGLCVSCPVLCTIALADSFAYLLLSLALHSSVARENYLADASYIRHIPVKRIRAVSFGFTTVFLLLMAFVLLPSFLAGGHRRYIDIRVMELLPVPEKEKPFFFVESTLDPELWDELGQLYGRGSTPSAAGNVIFFVIALTCGLLMIWILLRALKSYFLEFRDQPDGIDLAVSLKDEPVPAGKIRRQKKSREPLSEREQIRKRYRTLIRKRRAGLPAPWETPTQIEEAAGFRELPEGKVIHEEYEKARYRR